MKNYFGKLFCFLCAILFLVSALDTFGQKKLKAKTKITVAQQTEDEKRKEVETLMLQGKYQHDGSGELLYIGTIESVPALLKVLENNPPHTYLPCKNDLQLPPPPPLRKGSEIIFDPSPNIPPKDCSPKKTYICTYAHAISALRKITEQNFVDYEDWKNWWLEYSQNKEISK